MEEIRFSKLKGRIAELGVTKQSLAKILGLSRVSMHKKLSGKVPFKFPEIYKIAEILSIPKEELEIFFS